MLRASVLKPVISTEEERMELERWYPFRQLHLRFPPLASQIPASTGGQPHWLPRAPRLAR